MYVAETMKLVGLHIVNFRGLADIELEMKQRTAVIVGPNAMGKTTVLQAVRLVKALLFPSYQGETMETLSSLGSYNGASQQIDASSLFGDPSKELRISLTLRLSDEEIRAASSGARQIAISRVSASLGAKSSTDLIQYFTSGGGERRLAEEEKEISDQLSKLTTSTDIIAGLRVDPTTGHIRGEKDIDQMVLRHLAQRDPLKGLVSVFPADRNMPSGEVNVQFGQADITHQTQMHVAKPELKHQRLKQYIASRSILDTAERNTLQDDFNLVFNELLPGKEFRGIGFTARNTLTVLIGEKGNSRLYDVDLMSSGEKGLLLTFLLARRTVAKGGLALFDEPELHLNPTVCKKVLGFMIEHVVNPAELSAIICTHSGDILSKAYEREDCSLHQLRGPRDLSPVFQGDKRQAMDALKRLGNDTADVLFSSGTLGVEGPDDGDLLEAAFPERIAGLKVNRLGGRDEVEKAIRDLQAADAKGEVAEPHFFIFDHDNKPKPRDLSDSENVKVLQWDRYCLENYLLDREIIYKLQSDVRAGQTFSSGEILTMLKELAMNQIQQRVAQEAFQEMRPPNPGITSKELSALKSYEEVAARLAETLGEVRDAVGATTADDFKAKYIERCKELDKEVRAEFEEAWSKKANGKKILEDLHARMKCNVSRGEFKVRIAKAMAVEKSDGWRIVDHHLESMRT